MRDALVELRTALLAEPREAIVLVTAALPLEDEDERLGREARRVRRARGAVHDLAFPHDGDLLFAGGRAVVEVQVALDHVHDLVARVLVELAAELAAPRDEGDAVGRLPEDGVGPAGGFDGGHDLPEIDGLQLIHLPFLLR